MKKINCLIIPVLLLIAASCSNKPSKPKTTEEILNKFSKAPGINAGKQPYTFSVPKGWTAKDTVMHDIKFHFIFPPAEDAVTGVNINILNEAMSGLTFDQYIKASIKNMQNIMPGFKLLEQGDISSTSGTSIRWIHYLTLREGIELEGILYFMPHDGIAYLMTGIALKGKMAQYSDIFDRVAQSIKFKE